MPPVELLLLLPLPGCTTEVVPVDDVLPLPLPLPLLVLDEPLPPELLPVFCADVGGDAEDETWLEPPLVVPPLEEDVLPEVVLPLWPVPGLPLGEPPETEPPEPLLLPEELAVPAEPVEPCGLLLLCPEGVPLPPDVLVVVEEAPGAWLEFVCVDPPGAAAPVPLLVVPAAVVVLPGLLPPGEAADPAVPEPLLVVPAAEVVLPGLLPPGELAEPGEPVPLLVVPAAEVVLPGLLPLGELAELVFPDPLLVVPAAEVVLPPGEDADPAVPVPLLAVPAVVVVPPPGEAAAPGVVPPEEVPPEVALPCGALLLSIPGGLKITADPPDDAPGAWLCPGEAACPPTDRIFRGKNERSNVVLWKCVL